MDLSIDQIVLAANSKKEDLQRRANQGILRNDLNRAMTALAGIAVIDDFVWDLKRRSGSQLGLPRIPLKRRAAKRAREDAA